MLLQPEQDPWIKGLHAELQVRILIQQRADPLRQNGVVFAKRLDLHNQRCLPLKQGQDLLQIGDALPCSLQGQAVQLLRRAVADVFVHTGGPQQALVVHDHQTAVLAQMNVQLSTVTVLHCKAEGCQGIFRHALFAVMEAPVGVVISRQTVKTGLAAFATQAQNIQQQQYDNNSRNDVKHHGS